MISGLKNSSDKTGNDERKCGKEERDRAFMKAKTRAEKEAEGEVRGSAQMVSCQRPAVPVCVRVCTFICVCAVHTMHICGCYINVECMSALAFLCASMHVCVSVRVCAL